MEAFASLGFIMVPSKDVLLLLETELNESWKIIH
jgi:hypothetical protein